ncbi:MAG: hypothetical protein Q3998_02555 [Porphyromonas sp.]|nr:hypothetical protein [Porphyromonas sp.]
MNQSVDILDRYRNPIPTIAVRIARLLVGVLFLFSGVMKGIDPLGTAYKIEEYGSAFGIPVDETVALVGSVILSIAEATIGSCLLTGTFLSFTAWITLVLMAFFSLFTAYVSIANPVADCGCFGDVIHVPNSATLAKNLVLFFLTVIIFMGRDRPRVLRAKSSDIINIILFILFFLTIAHTNYHKLPVVDFRPYKVGKSLAKLKGYEPDSTLRQAEYDYKFIYRKGEIEMTFKIDEIEHLDSTWTYVRDASELISPGDIAPATDFMIINRDGVEITPEILASNSKVMLLISPDIRKVDIDHSALFNSLNRIARDQGGRLLLLVSNDLASEEVKNILTELKPEYSVAYMDESTAKTVVRSNPGLVVLDGSIIRRKVSISDLSDLVEERHFSEYPFDPPPPTNIWIELWRSWWKSIALFVIFLVLLFVDFGKRQKKEIPAIQKR